jgi:hypothetical protein
MSNPDDHPHNESFTELQLDAMATRRSDDDRTLVAMQALEAALAAAVPRREVLWRHAVLEALDVLREATATEQANADQPDSLLSDVARTQPRLRTVVRGLRIQYRQLHDAIDAMRDELRRQDVLRPHHADIRERLGWLLTALRHQQARESDLIYEAYYEAFNRLPDEEEGGQRLNPCD